MEFGRLGVNYSNEKLMFKAECQTCGRLVFVKCGQIGRHTAKSEKESRSTTEFCPCRKVKPGTQKLWNVERYQIQEGACLVQKTSQGKRQTETS